MFKAKQHIKNSKHIFWLCFSLFALSPCVVKEVMFNVANAEYVKPLNKTKLTAPTNPCQYSQNDNQQASVVKQSNISKQTEPINALENLFFVVRSVGINAHHSKTTSGNSPPKYILYKRLKLDVA